jgi:hypothetical protein
MMPALETARQSARVAACAHQLQQLELERQMFTNDFEYEMYLSHAGWSLMAGNVNWGASEAQIAEWKENPRPRGLPEALPSTAGCPTTPAST